MTQSFYVPFVPYYAVLLGTLNGFACSSPDSPVAPIAPDASTDDSSMGMRDALEDLSLDVVEETNAQDGVPSDVASDTDIIDVGADAADDNAPEASLDASALDGLENDHESGAPRLIVRVSGNGLVDGDGKPIRLLGVNHAGAEYACVEGKGVFDNRINNKLVNAMAEWHINAVRIPLNEHCWLGRNGADPLFSGAVYQRAVLDFIDLLQTRGIYAILDLHWTAAGDVLASRLQPMMNLDHSRDFWRSVAGKTGTNQGVIYDLFNEPYLELLVTDGDPWDCWLSGCEVPAGLGASKPFRSLGMQEAIDVIRNEGAKNVILLSGIRYGSDLRSFNSHLPLDSERSIAASFHAYARRRCNVAACWEQEIAPIAQLVPVVAAEIGQHDCAHQFIDQFMGWADGKGISYLGWTWNPWGCTEGPSLVTSLAGNPTAFGIGLRDHLLAIRP